MVLLPGGGFVPLALYAVQLAMNLAWSPLFFMKHEIGWALADITGVLVTSLASAVSVTPIQNCTLGSLCTCIGHAGILIPHVRLSFMSRHALAIMP